MRSADGCDDTGFQNDATHVMRETTHAQARLMNPHHRFYRVPPVARNPLPAQPSQLAVCSHPAPKGLGDRPHYQWTRQLPSIERRHSSLARFVTGAIRHWRRSSLAPIVTGAQPQRQQPASATRAGQRAKSLSAKRCGSWHRPALSGGCPPNTIGAAAFHNRVRDGSVWVHCAMDTRNTFLFTG